MSARPFAHPSARPSAGLSARPSARMSARRLRAVGVVVAVAAVAAVLSTPAASMAVGAAVILAAQRNIIGSENLDEVTPGASELWLIVGNDARSAHTLPAHSAHTGERADTLLLCVVPASGPATVIALPRDLRVEVAPYGGQRLGGLLDYGRAAVIDGVRIATGLPVHHYVEFGMDAVVAAVDASGGVDTTISSPARDRMTGLALEAGAQHLDGAQALAYVRSRQYEELHAGAWVAVPGDDEARLRRQLGLLQELFASVTSEGSRWRLPFLVTAVLPYGSVDRVTGAGDLAALMTALHGDWTTGVVPTHRVSEYEELLSPFPPLHLGGSPQRVLTQPAASALFAGLVGAQR